MNNNGDNLSLISAAIFSETYAYGIRGIYNTIVQLLDGTFDVPVSERTPA